MWELGLRLAASLERIIMALIKIEGATVAYINSKGFTAKAPVEIMGETRDEYYKVWTDQAVREGDLVDIVGRVSARLEEYKDKRTGDMKQGAALHVNDAKVTASAGAPF